jgi:hypothetical protein
MHFSPLYQQSRRLQSPECKKTSIKSSAYSTLKDEILISIYGKI